MTKERELLRRLQRYIGSGNLTAETLELDNAIDELLSTPSDDAEEPVAWMFPDDIERFQTEETFAQAFSVKCGSPTQGTTLPLYLHPPNPAEPEADHERNIAFDDEVCPVCGYYCNGKGGFGCIDKPVLTGLRKPPKPAEPEAEYDFYGVIPLTHRKAKGIIKDKGYHVTGFVLSRPDGDKCIVDMSAVRWLTGKEFFEMMHPPVVSPTAEPEANCYGDGNVYRGVRSKDSEVKTVYVKTAEPEAETIETLKAENFKLASGQCTEGGPWGDEGGTPYCKYAKRKPMSEEEAIELCPFTREEFKAGFLTGIRFAEKHHDITDADV